MHTDMGNPDRTLRAGIAVIAPVVAH